MPVGNSNYSESTNYGNFPRNVNKYFVARLFRESSGRVTQSLVEVRGGKGVCLGSSQNSWQTMFTLFGHNATRLCMYPSNVMYPIWCCPWHGKATLGLFLTKPLRTHDTRHRPGQLGVLAKVETVTRTRNQFAWLCLILAWTVEGGRRGSNSKKLGGRLLPARLRCNSRLANNKSLTRCLSWARRQADYSRNINSKVIRI